MAHRLPTWPRGAARDPGATGPLVVSAVALAATLLTVVITQFGPISLQVLALLAPIGAAVCIWLLYAAPQTLVILTPLLIPIPLVGFIFPYEIMLMLLALAVAYTGWRAKASWFFRLGSIELALLAFTGWALLTGFWCGDTVRYLLGVRRLCLACVTLWTAGRIARLVPRPLFELGLVLSPLALAAVTFVHWLLSGGSGDLAVTHRASMTDLGWGWANYIAALLLITAPLLLHLAQNAVWRSSRLAAWIAIPVISVVQGIIIARGAMILFVGGLLAQSLGGRRRRRLIAIGIAVLGIAVLLFGPWGRGILFRFTSLRELSSGTIRLWYFREAWRRTVDHFPFGIGLGQGWAYPDHLQGLDPHNYWLALSSELGVIGVAAWLLVLIALWRRIGTLAASPAERNARRALRVTFWLSQIHSMVEPTFQGNQYQFLFWWIFGGYLGYHAVDSAPDAAPKDQRAAASSSR